MNSRHRSLATSVLLATALCAQAPIALGAWTVESYPAIVGFPGGAWSVTADGLSAVATQNGPATFFVSDIQAPGSDMDVQITAPYTIDDDFIGFALGFQPGDTTNPNAHYVLIDWKRATQFFDFQAPSCTPGGTAVRGLAASLVTGTPTADELWSHANLSTSLCADFASGVVELARGTTLGAVGWVPGQTYTFHFEYGPGSVQVFVDGNLELNATGVFSGGRIAFYNYSQVGATYELLSAVPPPPPPPFLDLAVTAAGIQSVPAAPAVFVPATVSATIQNLGTASTTARGRFYLGDPDLGGALLNTQTAALGYAGQVTFSIAWTSALTGPRSIFFVADHTTLQTDVDLSNNRASQVFNVSPPPEALAVDAGEVTGWPGVTFSAPVSINNVGAGPTTITGVSSGSPWVSFANAPVGQSLAPGAVLTFLADVEIPMGTAGGPAGGLPLSYQLDINVTTSTNSYEADLPAKVFAQPTAAVTIQVLDGMTNAPLSDADVSIAGVPQGFLTNGAGQVVVNLPPGLRGFFAYRSGYIAGAVSATVLDTATLVTIALGPGQTLAVQQITSQQLTTPEILSRGIDPMQVGNNVVYDFVVGLQIGTITVPNIIIPPNPPVGATISFSAPCVCSGGGGGGGGTPVSVAATFTYTAYGRQETWIIIAGSVAVLRQFYEVSMFVTNNSVATNPSDIEIRNPVATLALPTGLALPDLNGMPQNPTMTFGTLNAGDSVTATWVVRGDAPGAYVLSGSSTGDLFAFGNSITTLTSSAQSAPFNVVLPQLRLEFITPTSVVAGQPFTFGVVVTNQQIATAQLVRVALKVEDLVNCALCELSMQPTTGPLGAAQSVMLSFDVNNDATLAEIVVGDIAPGQSKTALFCLTSYVSGDVLDVQSQIWSTNQASPPVALAARYPGSGGDCRLRTGVGGALNTQAVKLISGGDLLSILIDSPTGSLIGQPNALFVAVQPFLPLAVGSPIWLPPEHIPGLPELWVNTDLTLLIDGTVAGASYPTTILPGGTQYDFAIPPGLGGLRLMLQAIILSPTSLCATDGHELRLL